MAHTINLLHSHDTFTLRWTRRLRFFLSYAIDSAPANLSRIRKALIVHAMSN